MKTDKMQGHEILLGDDLWGIRYWSLMTPRNRPCFVVYTYVGSTTDYQNHFFRPYKKYGLLVKKTTKELHDDLMFKPFLIDMEKILEKTKTTTWKFSRRARFFRQWYSTE